MSESKTRVVLADDHALVRSGIRNALQELPNLAIVAEVGDGPSLEAALQTTQPDLLLVDLTMPSFEPLSALRQIRSAYADLCILVVSAYDDDVYVQGLLGAGINGYHLKDQPLSDLKLAVDRILAGGRWISDPLVDKLANTLQTPASSPLTARQRDILRLLQEALDNQSIADRLGLSVKTVEHHLTRLYRQLGVSSRLEAANYAMTHPEVLGGSGYPRSESGHTRAPGRASGPGTSVAPAAFTLLLVDDNTRYRTELRRMIGRIYPQLTIYEADGVPAAIQLARRLDLDLALVDVVLGDEDGIRCTRRLKACCPRLRVVLISAYPDREFHRLGLEAGAIAFLDKKDLDTASLRQLIDDVLPRSFADSPFSHS
jgi:DNA-binding NarL/FixJ family response regulator